MSGTIELSTGDALKELNVTLRDSNTGDPADPESWDPINLTDSSIRLDIYPLGSAVLLESFAFTKVSLGADGECYVPKQATLMTDEDGTYQGEIVITDAGLEDTVQERIKFRVKA